MHLPSAVTEIHYKGKIKLHGNNGGVVIREEEGEFIVEAQSRNQMLGPKYGGDLAGFAKWTAEHDKFFIHLRKAIKDVFPQAKKTVVFGEWCGTGIQRNVAICNINKKIFAVFSILVDEGLISDPDLIAKFFPQELPDTLHIIPWLVSAECGKFITLNYDNEAQLELEAFKINSLINQIDSLDPWVKEVFGVSGPGEGVVWYPVSLQTEDVISVHHFGKLTFKTKGTTHAVVKQEKPAIIKVEVSPSVTHFVSKFVTNGRGEQAISKVAGDEKPSKSHIGRIVQWLVADVKKESEADLQASGLTWKQVEKEVNTASRKWILEYLEKQ